uniref:DM2 domain-containing protein n=1 Tax=viral metagenome TaxID=1070528 RepID=A0A6C0KMB8_9ZZZZ
MPRQSKSTKTEVQEATTVPNPNVESVAPKKVKAAKAAQPVVPEVVVEPVVPEVAVESDVVDLSLQSTEFLSKLNQLGSLLASVKTEYRVLEKKWSRELKVAQKSQAKRKRKSGNRAPSGFVKPTKISDELAKFLDKPSGTEMARTDVTREINKYIVAHNLQDEKNGRKINPDPKLQTLLKLKNTDELTYFNLQKYMSPHFEKSQKALKEAAAAAAAVDV